MCAAALASLKRKKMLDSQLEQVENNLQRILEQQTMLEDQRLNMEALLAQQYAAKASKASMQVCTAGTLAGCPDEPLEC